MTKTPLTSNAATQGKSMAYNILFCNELLFTRPIFSPQETDLGHFEKKPEITAKGEQISKY
jgi:hypothetical protein